MIFHQHLFQKRLFWWRFSRRRVNARAKSLLTLMRLLFLTEISCVSLSGEEIICISFFLFFIFKGKKITRRFTRQQSQNKNISTSLSALPNIYIEKLKSTERRKEKKNVSRKDHLKSRLVQEKRTVCCFQLTVFVFFFRSLL